MSCSLAIDLNATFVPKANDEAGSSFNTVGVSTDGTSVMLKCKKGVFTQLCWESAGLLSTHCIAQVSFELLSGCR